MMNGQLQEFDIFMNRNKVYPSLCYRTKFIKIYFTPVGAFTSVLYNLFY